MWGVLAAALVFGTSQAAAQRRRSVAPPEQIVNSLTREDETVRKCVEENSAGRTFKAEWVT